MRLFTGRDDAYGTYDPKTGRAWQIKHFPAESVYRDHIKGRSPLAIYPLTDGKNTRFIVIDFDEPDGNLPKDAVRCAKHHGFEPIVEISRSKGFHVWFFFRQKVEAWKARALLKTILSEISYPRAEIFPKQDHIKRGYGNCINLPLFGRHVQNNKTVFINGNFEPVKDQWRFIQKVTQHSTTSLDTWIEINGIFQEPRKSPNAPNTKSPSGAFGLLPCFQTMLKQGVSVNQRIACFWIAVQLRKLGLPFESSLLVLQNWAKKNNPSQDKSIISSEEIHDQTMSAYKNDYRGCGCDQDPMHSFCQKSCPLITRR